MTTNPTGCLASEVRPTTGTYIPSRREVNDTLKGRLDLEQHGARTIKGVAVRVVRRVLATAAAIWHNNKTAAPVTRSLIAYDH